MVAAEENPESFFAAAPPLRDADAVAARLGEFIARNSSAGTGLPASPRHLLSWPRTLGARRNDYRPACVRLCVQRARAAAAGGSCAWRRAGRRCRWSSAACGTSTTSAPATAAPPPPSNQSKRPYTTVLSPVYASIFCCGSSRGPERQRTFPSCTFQPYKSFSLRSQVLHALICISTHYSTGSIKMYVR